jgi:hypothetical protein
MLTKMLLSLTFAVVDSVVVDIWGCETAFSLLLAYVCVRVCVCVRARVCVCVYVCACTFVSIHKVFESIPGNHFLIPLSVLLLLLRTVLVAETRKVGHSYFCWYLPNTLSSVISHNIAHMLDVFVICHGWWSYAARIVDIRMVFTESYRSFVNLHILRCCFTIHFRHL